MMARPVIAIIHHESHRHAPHNHLIKPMRRLWAEAGFEVKNLYGVDRFEPADIAFLHVDLSVVPEEYLDLASRYPRVINGKITDIRKRSYSINLVTCDDSYDGPVIVKTSLNSAGWPETFRDRSAHYQNFFYRLYWRLFCGNTRNYPFTIRRKSDYRIYPSLKEVPDEIWACPELVVERFLPERVNDKYCLREWYFFGDTEFYFRELSRLPVFTHGDYAPALSDPPPPEIREVRARLGIEYGKIDYVINEGLPVLFDVNKTTGMSDPTEDVSIFLSKELAKGIYTYFPEMEPAHLP